MAKSVAELLVGSLQEKREYKQLMKRVNALPKEYAYAFKKIQNYMYQIELEDYGMVIFQDLVELFESGVAHNSGIKDLIGSDVAVFCDGIIAETKQNHKKEKLNKEILEYFHKEVQ